MLFYGSPQEDAKILFEYANNLATRGLITYSQFSYPIEGATDFLWMVLISIFSKFNFDEYIAALIITTLSITFFLRNFSSNYEKSIFLIVLIFTPFFYSSLVGFSTISFSLFFAYLVFQIHKNYSERNFILILIFCLIRPDGVFWSIGIVLIIFLKNFKELGFKKIFRDFSIYLVLPGLIYFSWRFWYFNELLPLPFYVKSIGEKDFGIFFSTSISQLLLVFIPVVFSTAYYVFTCRLKSYKGESSFFRKAIYKILENRKELLMLLALFLIPVLIFPQFRLDQNIGNRFFAPAFFGFLIFIKIFFNIRTMLIYALLSILIMSKNTLLTIEGSINTQNPLEPLNQAISSSDAFTLTSEAGIFAYKTNLKVHDSWGLNTPKYAKELVNFNLLNEQEYDIVILPGFEIKSLVNAVDDSYVKNLSRTFSNHMLIVANYLFQKNYELYSLPFNTNEITLIGINSSSNKYSDLKQRINKLSNIKKINLN